MAPRRESGEVGCLHLLSQQTSAAPGARTRGCAERGLLGLAAGRRGRQAVSNYSCVEPLALARHNRRCSCGGRRHGRGARGRGMVTTRSRRGHGAHGGLGVHGGAEARPRSRCGHGAHGCNAAVTAVTALVARVP